MCGIVGYIGRSEAVPILLDGLRRLEYRGYDSAGVAIVDGDRVEMRKCTGRIANLARADDGKAAARHYGISHTRWATHGEPTDQNAHPHFDESGKLALVHNGVIENYATLKEDCCAKAGTTFKSQTDTEVLAHLIGTLYDASAAKNGDAPLNERRGWSKAVRAALKQVIGTYGIALAASRHAGCHRRRAPRQPARARRGQGRKFLRQRRERDRRLHARRRLSEGLRYRRGRARQVRDQLGRRRRREPSK